MKSLFQQTRSETLARHVTALLHDTRTTRESFAISVVEQYHLRVAESSRTVDFKTGGDLFATARTNTQRLFRMLDAAFEDSRFPADLEEAVLFALPEPFRTACRRDLAARMGLRDVPLAPTASEGSVRSVGEFLAAAGVVVQDLSQVLADGRIDASDAPYLAQTQADLEQLDATLQGLLCRVRQAREEAQR